MDKEEINEILEIVCCPYCSGDLEFKEDKLICKECKRIFQIKDDIIVLL